MAEINLQTLADSNQAAHDALVECLRLFARRGRQLRMEREQAEHEPGQPAQDKPNEN